MAEIIKNYDNGSSIKVVYSYSQNVNKNQSTLTMGLYVKRDTYGPSWNTRCNAYIQLDGAKVMTYSGSFRVGTSWAKIGETVSKTVSHTADGTKTVAITGFFDSLGLTTKLTDLTVSGSVKLTTIPRTSSFTISANAITAGSTGMTVNIARASSSFTHTVQWKFGSHTKSNTGVATSTSYTIPESWLDAIPNSISGTGTVTVTTYNGEDRIGSSSQNFTVYAGDAVMPTFTGITFTRIDGTVPSSWGVYVKTKSKVKATITSAEGIYGSTIQSYSISGGGYSGAASSLTTGLLNAGGTLNFTAKVTDSRGRTAIKTASITVVEYAPPQITSLTAVRCDADGTEQEDGAYISLKAEFSGSSVNGKNTVSGKYRYRVSGGTWSSSAALASGQAVVFPAVVDSPYFVEVQVSDAFATASSVKTVDSTSYIMDFRAGGKGIAFGKAADTDNYMDVAWKAMFNDTVTVADLNIIGDINFVSGWWTLKLASGVTSGTYGTRPTPSYRKIGSRVFIEGGVGVTIPSSGSVLLATLPAGFRPLKNVYTLQACSGTRVARVYLDTNGNLYCEWIYNLTDGSRFSGEISWMQIDMSFFVNPVP